MATNAGGALPDSSEFSTVSAIVLPAIPSSDSHSASCSGGVGHSLGKAKKSPVTKEIKVPRTITQITAKYRLALPPAMPVGPWASHDEAKTELEKWTKDTTIGGGGFGLVWQGGLTKATSVMGNRRKLLCHRCGPKTQMSSSSAKGKPSIGAGCPFIIHIEESTTGWVIKDIPLHDHSHELTQSHAESNAFSAMRFIPPQLAELAERLKAAHNSPKVINNTLKANARKEGIPVTWTYQQIYDRFAPSALEKTADASGLLEFLVARDKLELPYRMNTNSQGVLQMVIFALEDGQKIYEKAGPEDSCVCFDTTHNTNRLAVKLGLFVMQNPDGSTSIIAAALIVRETGDSFVWVLNSFKQIFGFAPAVAKTDQDAAMAVAFPKAWPGTKHQLCVFHVWINVQKTIRPLFMADCDKKGKSEGWQEFCKVFWTICKNSDSDSRPEIQFESEWNALRVVVAL